MLDEALPIIRSAFEAARSRAPKSKPTDVVKAAHFLLNSLEDNFEYSWKRGDGVIGITLWLEDVHHVSKGRWLLVESLNTRIRRGGGDRSPEQVLRAARRVENLVSAHRSNAAMVGFVQTNKVKIEDLESNHNAKVDVRLRDTEEWFVHEIDFEKDRVVLRRGHGWSPTHDEVLAAVVRRNRGRLVPPQPQVEIGYSPLTAPILYVNMAWMKRYRGHADDDRVHGGHFGWLKQDGRSAAYAHEQFNFLPIEERVYAYVPGSPSPAIHRLGASAAQASMKGVLVAFMARDPADGITKIVGCYHDATVHRRQEFMHTKQGIDVSSSITAAAHNAVVLPVAERSVNVPHWRQVADLGKAGYGQSAL